VRTERIPSPNGVNILYLSLGLAFLLVGGLVQKKELYTGILITEYLIILLPNILFLKLRGYSLKKVLKLNPISLKQGLFTVLTMIFAYPIAVFLNYIMMLFLNSVSDSLPTGVPIPSSWPEYWLALFVIAVTPGICEEVMFRGTMQSAYGRLGEKKALILSSMLFGLFHFNLMNFLGPAFLGLILGIIMIKTKSLYATIIGHTLNNGIALSIGFAASSMLERLEEVASGTPQLPSGLEAIAALVLLAGWGLFSLVILFLILKYFPKSQEPLHETEVLDEGFYEWDDNQRVYWVPVFVTIGLFAIVNYMYFLAG